MEVSESKKILLVGTKRNCRSIGYVLNFRNYEYIEKLTVNNYTMYIDHEIYICELKKNSKNLIQRRLLKENLKLQYLNDICFQIDEYYKAKQKVETRITLHQTKTEVDETTKNTSKTMQKVSKVESKEKHSSLLTSFNSGIKHPLRAVWHAILRLKWKLTHQLKRIRAKYAAQHYQYKKVDIDKYYAKYLCHLSPSALLMYVLRAPVNSDINCHIIETEMTILDERVLGCCNVMVPFGNLLRGDSVDEIYNGIYARIVKLSSLNGSYCLCNFYKWCHGYCSCNTAKTTKELNTPRTPKTVTLSFDNSCNLACKMCRNEIYQMDEQTRQKVSLITEKILQSEWLENAENILMTCKGEVFYSPFYRRLLMTNSLRKQITIRSNGTLFNKTNWELIANKFNIINVEISVDAATAETYQKIRRGGNFKVLMENLNMISELHRRKQINRFLLYFVVQRDNFREMSAFVELGTQLGVDEIQFQRMDYFRHIPKSEYKKQCMIIDNKYIDQELWRVLQNPIFKEGIVNLRGFMRYKKASQKLYAKLK